MSEANVILRAQVAALRERIAVEKQVIAAKLADETEDYRNARLEAERDRLRQELADVMGVPIEEVSLPEVDINPVEVVPNPNPEPDFVAPAPVMPVVEPSDEAVASTEPVTIEGADLAPPVVADDNPTSGRRGR